MKKLFTDLLVFYEPQPKPTKAFYEKWLKEMSQYNIRDVKTGLNILMNNKKYFPSIDECLTFVDSAATINRQRTIKKDLDKKTSRVEMDDEMRSWKQNLDNFLNKKITRGEYLKKAVEIGQMTLAEADKERSLYIRRGDSMDSYCNRTGLIKNIEPF